MIALSSAPNMSGISSVALQQSLKPISDMLRAMGDAGSAFVRVTTSNDINWAAIASAGSYPGANTPFAGHDIFRFNDDLQATAPLFIKVQYGQGATNTPGIFVTLGTAIDAAGVFTGLTFTTQKGLCPQLASTGTWPLFLSGGPSHFSFLQSGIGASPQGSMQCYIERMRDESGLETDEGFIMLFGGAGQSGSFLQKVQAFPASGGSIPAEALATVHLLNIGAMSGIIQSATDMVLAPIAVPHNGKWRYMTAMVFRTADLAHGAPQDLIHLGEMRHYIAMGGLYAGQKWNTPDQVAGILARWE
jgi:hypothetical protein